jgi:hypothetical protein
MAFNAKTASRLAGKHGKLLITDGVSEGASIEDMIGAVAIMLTTMVDAANLDTDFAVEVVKAGMRDLKKAQAEEKTKAGTGQGVN